MKNTHERKIKYDFENQKMEPMTLEEMLADIRRQKREIQETEVYYWTKDEMKALVQGINGLYNMVQKSKRVPLEVPFLTENAREKEYTRSIDYPNEYYTFRYFGVRITIWRHNKDDYSIACIGWYPMRSKRFTWRKGYDGKYAYYNRCPDIESAIIDWLLCIAEFFNSELGIYLDKQGHLDLDEKKTELSNWLAETQNSFKNMTQKAENS